jgi:succinate dehydrogenase hydrophobic anchor subunit
MNFFKQIVLAVYAFYRRRNGSYAAVLHARVAVSLVLLIYFTVIFIFLYRIINIRALSNFDFMKTKEMYISMILPTYVLVHFLGGTNKVLEENGEWANRGFTRSFFVLSIIGVVLLLFIVPYANT